MALEIHENGVHKNWDNNKARVIQEFLSTREYAKESRPFRSALFRAYGLSNSQGTFHRFLFKYFFSFKGRLRVGKKFLSPLSSFAWLSMFRLPKQLTAHPYCALWRNICSCRCILCPLLPNAIRVLFPEKALFLRFSFSFTSLIPCPLPPRDEREKTERTPTQLPANKKCCLLIFAIAIGCLVLAATPASYCPPPFCLSIVSNNIRVPLRSATCCVFASDLAKFSPLFFRYRWLLCSRGSAREISSPLNLKL